MGPRNAIVAAGYNGFDAWTEASANGLLANTELDALTDNCHTYLICGQSTHRPGGRMEVETPAPDYPIR